MQATRDGNEVKRHRARATTERHWSFHSCVFSFSCSVFLPLQHYIITSDNRYINCTCWHFCFFFVSAWLDSDFILHKKTKEIFLFSLSVEFNNLFYFSCFDCALSLSHYFVVFISFFFRLLFWMYLKCERWNKYMRFLDGMTHIYFSVEFPEISFLILTLLFSLYSFLFSCISHFHHYFLVDHFAMGSGSRLHSVFEERNLQSKNNHCWCSFLGFTISFSMHTTHDKLFGKTIACHGIQSQRKWKLNTKCEFFFFFIFRPIFRVCSISKMFERHKTSVYCVFFV